MVEAQHTLDLLLQQNSERVPFCEAH